MSQFESLIVECAEDCGNAPKKELLRDLTIAFAKNDTEFCINCMRDDIVWEMIGQNRFEGIGEYKEALNNWKKHQVKHLIIHNIITHGNTASLNGTMLLEDETKIDFCDVYNFAGFGKKAKIKKITSYVIKTI